MEDRINETAAERQERYEVAFLEYLDENEACGIALEDWANEHGLDSEYLTKTGILSGFAIPLGKSIRKQREDFSAPFEPTTADTEIAPIVRREESKAVMRSAPKPVIDKPKKGTSESRPKRKPGRPKKTTPIDAAAEPPKEPISTTPDFSSSMAASRTLRKDDVIFVVTGSEAARDVLLSAADRVKEIITETEGFRGRIEIVAEEPADEKENDIKEETMPKTENETKKPSFRMLDGTAVLEEDGFYMEVAVNMTNANEIKEKIDLLYSSFEKFRAIG